MKVIHGRLGDLITLSSGKRLSPHHFYIALDTVPGITQWRLVQETPHRLLAEVVVNQGSSDGARQTARANLQAIVGDGMEIVISEVQCFPNDPSKKFRSVQSLVH